MIAVSLTFPGHFFQTKLSIQSIKQWYDVDRHYVIVDEYEKGPWESYFQDACCYYGDGLNFITTASMPHLQNTLSGWWRQQLVKLTLDDILPEDSWLIVDGDVIFETFCPYQDVVPVSIYRLDYNNNINVFTRNYVKNLLGVEKGHIEHDVKFCLTNPVPNRW